MNTVEEYLTELKGQIRDKYAKEFVTEEIKNHIEEQAEAYRNEGIPYDEALSKAVRDMGDPVSVGVELDRIHRPHMEWKFLVYILLISLLSIVVHYLINKGVNHLLIGSANEQSIINNTMLRPGLARRHIFGILAGLAAMFAVCRADYTLLLGRSRVIGGVYIAGITICSVAFGYNVNGGHYWLGVGGVSISVRALLMLYLPLFAGILYELRSKEKSNLLQILFWMMLPGLAQWVICEIFIPVSLFMLIAESVLVCLAIRKEWYAINKKMLCYGLAGGFVSGIAVLIVAFRNMKAYRVLRIQSWLGRLGIGNMAPDPDGMDYINVRLQEVFAQSQLIGRSDPAAEIMSMMTGFRDDFILGTVAAFCGKLVVAGILLMMGILAVYIIQISLRQKNCLGYIVGCACGIMIALQSIGNALIVFGLLPLSSSTLPFFSHGISYGIMNYAQLGLILSIYRYKDIRREKVVEYSEKAVL